jgi:MFS transporter, DHA1 family, multidrug resistance protein
MARVASLPDRVQARESEKEEPAISPGLRKRTLIGLTGQVFLSLLGIGIVGPVLPLYAQSFGVSAAMVGSLVTVFGLARLFTNLPAGRLADRLGRKPLLVGGMGLVSVSALLSGLAPTFAPLLAFRFIQGIGSAMQTTGAMVALSDISTIEDRGRIMSLYMGSLLLGASLGPSVGGLVGQQWGFRAPFFAYSFLALLGTLWAFFLTPETLKKGTGSRARGKAGQGESLRDILALLGKLMRDGRFVAVSFVSLVIFMTRAGSRSTVLPLFADSIGLGPGQIGLVLTIMAAINLVAVRSAGVFADRFGRKAVIVPSAMLTAIALVVFPMSHSYGTFIAAAALWGLGTAFVGPAPAAYVADIAPEGQRGTTMGLFKTFGDVGVTLGPLILGWLSDKLSYGAAFQTNAILFVLAGLMFAVLARETIQRGPGRAATQRTERT